MGLAMQLVWSFRPSRLSSLFPKMNSINPPSQFRAIEPLLSSTLFPHPARVIWMSSLEASSTLYSGLEDWQTKTTESSYQISKYQIDILATHLDNLSLIQAQQPSSQGTVIRHMVTHPGICSTNVNKDITGPFMDTLKLILFYIVRVYSVRQNLHILIVV